MRHLVSGGSARKPDHAPHPYDDAVGMAWRSRDADRGRDRDCTIRCGIWYEMKPSTEMPYRRFFRRGTLGLPFPRFALARRLRAFKHWKLRHQEDRRGSPPMLHVPTTTQLAWLGDHEMTIVGEIGIVQSAWGCGMGGGWGAG